MIKRVIFVYLGRRGFSRFALDVARAAIKDPAITPMMIVSRQNESHESFSALGPAVVSVDTFERSSGAIFNAWRIREIRSELRAAIEQFKPELIIELMPHVWSSFIFSPDLIRDTRYIPIIHDYQPHAGDYRSACIVWSLKRLLRRTDVAFTLSGAVAGRLEADSANSGRKIVTLFHPDLDFGASRHRLPPPAGSAMRLLFFGRIMHYKGLPVFLDMVDELRLRGISVEVGVIGEGNLGSSAPRLAAMGAEVINRWLRENEIGDNLSRFHAVILSHIEASQSGIAAAALGAGMPVVATPVGGIIEQILNGETGLIAKRADAIALADAVSTMFSTPGLYAHMCRRIDELRGERSIERFVHRCIELASR
jgi:glycosyltransferase involved in cell wall biosynthesis